DLARVVCELLRARQVSCVSFDDGQADEDVCVAGITAVFPLGGQRLERRSRRVELTRRQQLMATEKTRGADLAPGVCTESFQLQRTLDPSEVDTASRVEVDVFGQAQHKNENRRVADALGELEREGRVMLRSGDVDFGVPDAAEERMNLGDQTRVALRI